MKKLISKFTVLASLVVLSMSACKKDPNAEKEVTGTGATTFELAKGAAISANGTTGASLVTINAIVGEAIATNKAIARLEVYVLKGTTSSSSKVLLKGYDNVALAASSTTDPVVTAIGAYGNAANVIWGLKFTYPLSSFVGLTNPTTTKTTGSTSVIFTLKNAAGTVIAEYTATTAEYGLKLSN
ncbi:hypothetical protein [Pedobacter nototheniae]|uniref:hypothetical protein n=1 Tax=Pedobacter nototheniae TaxID=2488994 RepID=UPI00292DF21C|nr:hypothetical protein [Pedobacter nototheniae]